MTSESEVRAEFEAEVQRRAPHLNSSIVVDSLSVGLRRTRELMYRRVCLDTFQQAAADSMAAYISAEDEQRRLKQAALEIDSYAAVLATDELVQLARLQQPPADICQQLLQLQLADDQLPTGRRRWEEYEPQSTSDRRLRFIQLLQRAMPMSAKAPLVLFRLYPRAVRIVVASAFGDPLRAQQLRAEQCSILPAIADCHQCHGGVLDNEDHCPVCENPVWTAKWLQSD